MEANVLKIVYNRLSERKGSLRILVTGRTGTGKSALVNSIVGQYVAEESVSPDPETTKVTNYEKEIREVTVTVYDSPGLQDGTRNEAQYLKDLEKKCGEVDLNLYCIKMNDRFHIEGELNAMKKLSRAFGMEKFWRNTLFVLTFANELSLPKGCERSLQEYFKMQMSRWEGILHQQALIEEVGIDSVEAKEVPVIPAGYSDELSLPATNDEYWLSTLWFNCLQRTSDGAKPLLLKINWKRLRTSDSEVTAEMIEGFPPIVTGNQKIKLISEICMPEKPQKMETLLEENNSHPLSNKGGHVDTNAVVMTVIVVLLFVSGVYAIRWYMSSTSHNHGSHKEHIDEIKDLNELIQAVRDVGKWQGLCRNLNVDLGKMDMLKENSNSQPDEQKAECLTAYFNSGEARWSEVVDAVAKYPINNRRLAKQIAKDSGLPFEGEL